MVQTAPLPEEDSRQETTQQEKVLPKLEEEEANGELEPSSEEKQQQQAQKPSATRRRWRRLLRWCPTPHAGVPRLRAWWSVIRLRPSILLAPAVFFAVAVTLGVWGVVHASNSEISSQKVAATALGETVARSMKNALSRLFTPANSAAALVATTPSWDVLSQRFPGFATGVTKTAKVEAKLMPLYLWPQGVLVLSQPPSLEAYGFNVFSTASLRATFLDYVKSDGIVLTGPFMYSTPTAGYEGAIYGSALVPVFISNVSASETFAIPGYNGTLISPDCYNATTRTKFWGFAACSVQLNSVFNESRNELHARGYHYSLVNPSPKPLLPRLIPMPTIFQSAVPPSADAITISVTFDATGDEWLLTLSPESGYSPLWKEPLIALVVIVAFILAMLLHFLMLSRYKHRLLLEAILPPKVIDRMHSGLDSFLNLGQYTTTGTPADKILSVTADFLEGKQPALRDVVMIRTAIKESANIYSPLDVTDNIKAAFDDEVAQSLLQQLQLRGAKDFSKPVASGLRSSASFVSDEDSCFANLQQGLLAILDMDGPDAAGNTEDTQPDSVIGAADASDASHTVSEDAQAAGSPDASSPAGLAAFAARQFKLARAGSGGSNTPGKQGAIKHRRSVRSILAKDSAGADGGASHDDGSSAQQGSAGVGSEHIVPRFPIEEVELVLAGSWEWQYDLFRLQEVTSGRALSVLGFYTIYNTGLIKHFNINGAKLARFLRAAEDMYRPNPYHSSVHAACVVHGMHMMLERGGLAPGYADALTRLACLVAAAVHDLDHNGRTNDFLINTSHDLALFYNDKSPQENHHLASTFALLKNPELNFLSCLTNKERVELRRMVIELVMGTDMKVHFQLVSQFGTLHRLGGAAPESLAMTRVRGSIDHRTSRRHDSPSGPVAPRLPTIPDHRESQSSEAPSLPTVRQSYTLTAPQPAERSSVSVAGGSIKGSAHANEPRKCTDEAERLLNLQIALKCSDLSHMGAPLAVHCRWVSGLEEEFFRQGDAEREAGLPISPLFDRQKPGVSKSQTGFYDFVVIPLFSNLYRAFPGMEPMHNAVMSNYHYWVAEKVKQDGVRATPLRT